MGGGDGVVEGSHGLVMHHVHRAFYSNAIGQGTGGGREGGGRGEKWMRMKVSNRIAFPSFPPSLPPALPLS